MMPDEVEVDEGYHYDFTTASEWEIFIARLEEVITDWGLSHNHIPVDFTRGSWRNKYEKITFADVKFILYYYYWETIEENNTDQQEVQNPLEEMMTSKEDFKPGMSILENNTHLFISRWYGFKKYLLLVPTGGSSVSSESKIKILLSSLYIAVNNAKCAVPFFIQVKEPWQRFFMGVYQGKGIKTEFEMIHLRRTPSHCKYLTGLLTLFKSKINENLLSPVDVSIRFTYALKDWTNSSWSQDPPDFDFLGGETLGVSELGLLPFGATFDPISELYLYVTWSQLLENSIVDSESYTDLEPIQGQKWALRIKMSDNLACLLSDYFNEFLQILNTKHKTHELLSSMIEFQQQDAQYFGQSLNKLTESRVMTLSDVIGKAKGKTIGASSTKKSEGPISNDLLMSFLYYLFPDADENTECPYSDHLLWSQSSNVLEDKPCKSSDERLNGMKSAPYDSLAWRLATLMAHVVHSLGGVKAAAHLWYEFTQELRFRWEHGVFIPGVVNGFPDPRTCLLNQKLQLLNCCIDRKIAREKRAMKPSDEDSESELEDEFFDCSEEADEEELKKKKVRHAPWDQPVGRLQRHGELKLLTTGEDVYIPVTQDPVPKTEDQLEEDAEVLLQLGTDAHGSELRARMMSASLFSDMEAFKAANPGCQLADFIRWYSPRDWVQDDGVYVVGQPTGHLSNRMQIPGNTWADCWQAAKPVPARWQKRLFDDTREAEKALNYLDSKNPSEFIQLVIPVMAKCVLQRLLEETNEKELPIVAELNATIIKKAERISRSPKVNQRRYEELLSEITNAETLVVQAKSLKQKFIRSLQEDAENANYQHFMDFIRSLLTEDETIVPGGALSGIGQVIKSFFADAVKADQLVYDYTSQITDEKWNLASNFPAPCEKEFILRARTCDGPQRLHAVLKREECRFAGGFTRQDVFCSRSTQTVPF